MDAEIVILPANQPTARFYRGGERIVGFRRAVAEGAGKVAVSGEEPSRLRLPEDWVASTTCLAGENSLGLTRLPDSRSLADAVTSNPFDWLGADHVGRYGADTRLLVKLLDAGERLPVHAHPDAEFAGRWLGRTHGKVEAWHLLEGGEVYLGLRESLTAAELRRLVDKQDVDALLGALHRRIVAPGDTVYVPAGTLHAIGSGVFLVELQEPEDLSVLLEWRDFELDGRTDGHLGLGFDRALEAVDLRALDDARVDSLIARADASDALLPAEAGAYFRLERIHVDGACELEPGFAVLVVIGGAVATGDGARLAAGTTAVVPHAAGRVRLVGTGTVVVARPPSPMS